MQIVTLELIRIFKFLGFPGGSVEKNLPANAGDTGNVGLIPGLGRSPGGGNGNPLQYSCLEHSTDRRAWQAAVSPEGHKELDTTSQLSTHRIRHKEIFYSLFWYYKQKTVSSSWKKEKARCEKVWKEDEIIHLTWNPCGGVVLSLEFFYMIQKNNKLGRYSLASFKDFQNMWEAWLTSISVAMYIIKRAFFFNH